MGENDEHSTLSKFDEMHEEHIFVLMHAFLSLFSCFYSVVIMSFCEEADANLFLPKN